MSTSLIPARLHVLLARESEHAVVIRRGPSKRVCTIAWERRTDTFTLGQWQNGRIYERRSDLSPDGKHLIYFAMNGQWKSETQGSWTAISRSPYLKAMGLWSKGDCWHGGGLFLSNREYWINDGYGHSEMRVPNRLARISGFPFAETFGGECPGVYYHRLIRDGWRLRDEAPTRPHDGNRIFEKTIRDGWRLTKFACAGPITQPGRGCYFDEHEVSGPGGETVDGSAWEWADWDGRRLYWTRAGRLYAAAVSKNGPGEPDELQDFNGMRFEAVEAPY